MSTIQKYVAAVSNVPIRRAPDDRAEMINQLLLGETVFVLSRPDELWMEVQTVLDGYRGFVSALMMQVMPRDWDKKMWRLEDKWQVYGIGDESWLLPMGSRVKVLSQGKIQLPDGRIGTLDEPTYRYWKPGAFQADPIDFTERMIAFAEAMQGTPYLWGGRTTTGIDCSGLIQTSALLAGKILPRDAKEQVKLGLIVENKTESLERGDLLYFSNNHQDISHVALYLGNEQYIHASGFVRINSLNASALNFSKRQSETFVTARRIKHL
jgi:gamma-D-glutamyl-L-lysine dipeptidyl-peptidase